MFSPVLLDSMQLSRPLMQMEGTSGAKTGWFGRVRDHEREAIERQRREEDCLCRLKPGGKSAVSFRARLVVPRPWCLGEAKCAVLDTRELVLVYTTIIYSLLEL